MTGIEHCLVFINHLLKMFRILINREIGKSKTEKVLLDFKPDAVFVLGDTNSCLGLYSAKRL